MIPKTQGVKLLKLRREFMLLCLKLVLAPKQQPCVQHETILGSLGVEMSDLQAVILCVNGEGEKWANYNGVNFFLISSN